MGGARYRASVGAVCFIAAATLVFLGPPSIAAENSVIHGTVVDAGGLPQPGFRVVFRDTTTGQEIVSEPSGGAGQYSMSVPVGTSYKLLWTLGPDGKKGLVQDVPPFNFVFPTNVRFDVLVSSKQANPEGPYGDATCSDGIDNDLDGLADGLDLACKQIVLPPKKWPWIVGGGLAAAAAAAAASGGGSSSMSPS